MTQAFRNAYHFVPRLPGEELTLAPSHDRYTGLSGRITCTLTLEQPTVIGGKRSHTAGDYHRLEQFVFEDDPAIPATSLKGLISSIAEAASLSRYRVLEDEALTVLLPMRKRAESAAEYLEHRKTDLGSVHDYVDGRLKPVTTQESLGLADQMFGFVIDKATGPGSAYAGHVRPSIGTIISPVTEAFDTSRDYRFDSSPDNWVRLKELSQPMKGWPKSNATHRSATPNFYFREKASGSSAFLSKKDFAAGKSNTYEIQGQKAYLHHLWRDTADSQPWRTAAIISEDTRREGDKGPAADRKTAVRPLNKGVKFTFTFDFDNLSEAMLDLLCFALRPNAAFRHKIGYGKALGLGSVRIDPEELVLVDRTKRYGEEEDIFAARTAVSENVAIRAERHAKWLDGKHPAALKALLLIGETHDFSKDGKATGKDAPPVLWVPLTTEKFGLRNINSEAEKESYRWFSNNDRARAGNQRLKPIAAGDAALPILQTESRPGRGGGHNPSQTAHGQRDTPQPQVAGGSQAPLHRNVEGQVTIKGPNFASIRSDHGEVGFSRSSASIAVWSSLQQGDDVRFDIVAGPAGLIAINIRLDG